MRFCGRKEGISALSSFWKTVRRQNVSQMVSVIGRRRVGKTTLVLKAFENEAVPFLYLFVSQRVSESDLVQAWLNEVCRSAGKCFRHNRCTFQLPSKPVYRLPYRLSSKS